MNDIINKINNNIEQLNYRLNQLSYSKKNIKFYYVEKISEIKKEIIDLKAQLIYYKNFNSDDTIDIHGATKYFVENYLNDLLYFKMDYHQKITLITGKGSFIIFNSVKKYLESEKIKYSISNYIFTIILY